MTKVPRASLLGRIAVLGLALSSAARAQPAPSTAHPRIWLNAATRMQFAAQAGAVDSPVAKGMARCAAARERPAEYATGGWQGFEFVTTLSACLTAYVAKSDTDDLATALKYWTVLLDDYQNVGDGLGGDSVVTHDTGYAMRTFAPFSALAYDWLHDAPGVTEDLRAHARARFEAWSTYYSTGGYLRDLPGANYQAGYAFAATLMAIAEAGEAGAAGDAHWLNVRDTIWQKDLVPAFAAGHVLDGGDWPEGWQYGSLSVLELSLAARALQDNGVHLEGAGAWASSLPLRFAYGLTPAARQAFTGGDSDAPTPYRKPDNGALLAALAGPASDDAKALARKLNQDLKLTNENPLFDALAEAASAPAGGTPPVLPSVLPPSYLARGTGNWYVRGDWSTESTWGVFQCSRHLVDDHQYANAGNWVLTRGADDLVVDPSPYGSLSTLTGNAPAIDTASLPEGYSPSQGYWGKKTGLVWSRQSGSGIASARCDYADQFQRSDVPSDVPLALRDFVMVPQAGGATVVLVDRANTGAAGRGLHLRVRTPATLTFTGDSATGNVGASSLTIQKLWTSGGAANVRAMPQGSECPSSSHACDVSKLPAGSEYRVDVSGPAASAIHVVSAATGTPTPSVLLSGAGYRGALLGAEGQRVAVVGADTPSVSPPISLTYRVPASDGTVHVVLDAPVDAEGQSDVSASRDGTDCLVEVKAHSGAGTGLNGRPLVVRASSACALSDDGDKKPIDTSSAPAGSVDVNGPPFLAPMSPSLASGGGSTTPLDGSRSATSAAAGTADASCSLTGTHPTPRGQAASWTALGLLGLFRLARRRRPR